MRVVAIPVRLLCKARDVYVKSIIDCSTRMGYGHSMALPTGQYPPLPWSFGIGSSRCNDNEDYRKLVRAASARSLGQRNEIEMFIQQLRLQQSSIMVGSKMFLPKSCGVGMGIIGLMETNHAILKQAQAFGLLECDNIYLMRVFASLDIKWIKSESIPKK
ncbi:hypothetical protein POTOM_010129 [Populus tomentosa]|uniref:Uncharacterized protein n=1 Tax=Populus tomentosa TaxID=118781 RepID=A0A8X8ACP1_POPTO|nr:hypothetical protein POTOM_010129 [Populus tomentosa]